MMACLPGTRPMRYPAVMHRQISPLDRMAYAASQAVRFGWFYSQYRRAQRRITPAVRKADAPTDGPSTRELLAALFALFRRDLANIEAGLYAMPPDMWPRPDRVLRVNRRFFRDLRAVDRRRQAGGGDEVFRTLRARNTPYPRYFLQNFHFQSGGYLTAESADLYDYQVEILFSGGADAMRRQALVPLADFMKERAATNTRLLDIGCGTGRFLQFAGDTHPLVRMTGIDLSTAYIDRARRDFGARRGVTLATGNAECLPLPDTSVDAVSCIFLFHELPRRVRSRVADEMARVLRPGGLVVHVDSIQTGDVPRFDPLLGFFPRAYHEPYFADYVTSDLDALYRTAGLAVRSHTNAFLSKVSVFAKPA